ncbi:hypothetical protein M3Y97_00918000 [Aphelenchoides bicaudatus]|nr:hypothetical protein M3Y97_00918000 [Aphelenchoides bicaudatus]
MDTNLLCGLFALLLFGGSAIKMIVKDDKCPLANMVYEQIKSTGMIKSELLLTDDNQNNSITRALISNEIRAFAFHYKSNKTLFVLNAHRSTVWIADESAKSKGLLESPNVYFDFIAVDPLTNNLYFIDNSKGIGVCSIDFLVCTVMISKFENHDGNFRYYNLMKAVSVLNANNKTVIDESLDNYYASKYNPTKKEFTVHTHPIAGAKHFKVEHTFEFGCGVDLTEKDTIEWQQKFEKANESLLIGKTYSDKSTQTSKVYLDSEWSTLPKSCKPSSCSGICLPSKDAFNSTCILHKDGELVFTEVEKELTDEQKEQKLQEQIEDLKKEEQKLEEEVKVVETKIEDLKKEEQKLEEIVETKVVEEQPQNHYEKREDTSLGALYFFLIIFFFVMIAILFILVKSRLRNRRRHARRVSRFNDDISNYLDRTSNNSSEESFNQPTFAYNVNRMT